MTLMHQYSLLFFTFAGGFTGTLLGWWLALRFLQRPEHDRLVATLHEENARHERALQDIFAGHRRVVEQRPDPGEEEFSHVSPN